MVSAPVPASVAWHGHTHCVIDLFLGYVFGTLGHAAFPANRRKDSTAPGMVWIVKKGMDFGKEPLRYVELKVLQSRGKGKKKL
jgi:hypothetical protein